MKESRIFWRNLTKYCSKYGVTLLLELCLNFFHPNGVQTSEKTDGQIIITDCVADLD